VSQELAIPADLLLGQEALKPADRLELLYDRTHQRLFRLGCRMTGSADAALDLIQETFLRAAGRPEAVPRDERHAEAWLVRVLVNLCRDQLRKQTVRRKAADRVTHLAAPAAAEDPEAAAVARDLVKAALAALAPRRRAVIALCELEELPVREAARLLGLAEVTVRWHLVVGRREMAARLGKALP
jgi:RNA polymerase sigma-70 factor (ECF subfamily)